MDRKLNGELKKKKKNLTETEATRKKKQRKKSISVILFTLSSFSYKNIVPATSQS